MVNFWLSAHDQRDFDFAKKYQLEITQVVSNNIGSDELLEAYTGEGKLVNSDFLWLRCVISPEENN